MQVQTKKEKTMQHIIDSTIKLFSSKGYSATTTSLIAKDAGVSEAIIFKHFKTKENLLKEIGSMAIGEIIENISIIPLVKNIKNSIDYPPRDFLKSIIQERLEFVEKNIELLKLLLIEMQYNKSLKEQTSKLLFPKVFDAFEYIKKIIVHKSNVSEKKAGVIARLCLGFVESIIIQKYILGIEISKDEVEEEIEETLEILSASIK